MIIDQDRVGGLERRLAHEPAIDVLELLGGELVDALAHGGEAKIGAVGDHDGEQRTIDVTVTRLVPAKRLEGGDEAAPFVERPAANPRSGHAACML